MLSSFSASYLLGFFSIFFFFWSVARASAPCDFRFLVLGPESINKYLVILLLNKI